MKKRRAYHFIAGEQHMQFSSVTMMDAWLKLTLFAKKNPVADEFRQLPIECYAGDSVKPEASRTWDQWQDELIRDTYGDDWQEAIERFDALK